MRDPFSLKIIHSSLKEVLRYGSDSDFPSSSPAIGLLIKRKSLANAIDLSVHYPRISSLIEGEILECEDNQLDIRIRQELLNLAERCQELSDYLISEKTRLETLAESDSLIDDNREESMPVASKVRANREPRESKPSPILDVDLDLFT